MGRKGYLVGTVAAWTALLGACSSNSAGVDPGKGDGPPAATDAGRDLTFVDGTTADVSAAIDAAAGDAAAGDGSVDAASYALTVTIDGEGTVDLDPGAAQCTTADSPCSTTFAGGTTVTLSATPGADHVFDHWSGDCGGTVASTAVTLDGARACSASFLGQTGEIGLIPAPASVVPNTTEDDVKVMLFVEQANLELGQPLAFDSHVPGTFTSLMGHAGGEIPAGTPVNVYFLHFDPVGSSSAGVTRVGTLILPQPVLALSYVESTLDATDAEIGHPNVTYPGAGTHPDRDLELTSQDEFTLGDDRRTLQIDYYTSTSSDQVRIITAASGQLSLVHSSDLVVASTPPGDVTAGATEDSAAVLLFEESSSTLGADLTVDLDAPGSYTSSGATLPGGTLAAGTAIKSYLLHFDPTGTASASVTASVTFDTEVLGLVVETGNLDASDNLGAGGTAYPTGNDVNRGGEVGSGDTLVFYGDRRSLRFSLSAQNSTDQLRVLVAAP